MWCQHPWSVVASLISLVAKGDHESEEGNVRNVFYKFISEQQKFIFGFNLKIYENFDAEKRAFNKIDKADFTFPLVIFINFNVS